MTKTEGSGRADSGMEHFGYKESLDRSIGSFGSFAAGVSYISILTGTFQLFYFGFGTAGPAYLWSWPLVLVGQLAVALCFMELAAKYPVAGSVYNWSKQLGSRVVGWSSGWLMLTASIVTLSAVVLALQLNLPRLWRGFQIVGDGKGAYDFATNAVILGTVLILFTTMVNALGVRLMAMINSAGVFIELIAACLIAIILALQCSRGPAVFFSFQRLWCRPERRLSGRFPGGVAGLGIRDVWLRHRQLTGRGDPGAAAHRTQGDSAGHPGVVRHWRSDPGVRRHVGTQSRRSADRQQQRRFAIHRRTGDVGATGQDFSDVHRGRGDGVRAGRAYGRHPLDLCDGARQRAPVWGQARPRESRHADADRSGRS